MLRLLSSGERGVDDPLASERDAERFVHALPAADPLAAQRALCEALARAGGVRTANLARLRALAVLDRTAKRLRRELMGASLALGAGQRERDDEIWRGLAVLCSTFADHYEMLLEEAVVRSEDQAWRRQVPAIVVALFGHRETDLLHSLLRYEAWPGSRWAGVLAAYRYVLGLGVSARSALDETTGEQSRALTPEQALIRLLLLHRLEGGQFTPQESIVARGWIGRWAGLVRLVAPGPSQALPPSPEGFAVDLREVGGLRRPTEADNGCTGSHLFLLDTTPIIGLLDREITTARIAAAQTSHRAAETARRLALQSKLRVVLAAKAVRVRRRDERTETGLMTMQVIAGGLPGVFRMLRDEARFRADARLGDPPHGGSIEISAVPETSAERLAAVRSPGADAGRRSSPDAYPDAPLSIWQVRDQSRSGCRLRGRVAATQALAPGTLIACRGAGAAPWTLAVVRRLKRLRGSNVELGVEYLGSRPQQVVLFGGTDACRDHHPRGHAAPPTSVALRLAPPGHEVTFAALTLVLPPHERLFGRTVTMLSSAGEQSIRLGEPLETQRGFVHAPFEACDSDSARAPVAPGS